MQTGSSETLIGWKSGQTTMSLYGTEWRKRVAMDSAGKFSATSIVGMLSTWNIYNIRCVTTKLAYSGGDILGLN